MTEQPVSQGSEGLFTVAEAATEAGISLAAVYQAIERGDLIAISILGKKAVTRSSLATYMETRRVGRKPKPAGDQKQNGHS